MLTLYVIAAVVGGVFVLLSALGGGDHDHDCDQDFDLHSDLDLDLGTDVDLEVDLDGDAESDLGDHHADVGHADIWLPFLSMRFWTYFLAFFGVTGLLLTWLWQGGVSTGLLAGAMGTACGLGMAYGTRYLRTSTTHSAAGVRDLVGSEAEVLFGVSAEQVGKIRCRVKGSEVDLLATTDDDGTLQRGSRALIIGFDGPTARVVRVAFAISSDLDDEEEEQHEQAAATATAERREEQ